MTVVPFVAARITVRQSHGAIDPYVYVTDVEVLPPMPNALPQRSNRLSIFVPEDGSVLHMGGGAPPGITAKTRTNVTLHADAAWTTVALGANSSLGAPDGLAVHTDGDLTEQVKLGRSSKVELDELMDVTGNSELRCKDRTETMKGKHDVKTTGLRKETVDGTYDLTTGPRTDTVTKGDYKIVNNVGKITMQCMEMKEQVLTVKDSLVVGGEKKSNLGFRSSFWGGVSQSNYVGLVNNNFIGAKIEGAIVNSMSAIVTNRHLATKLEKIVAKIEKTDFGVKKHQVMLKKSLLWLASNELTLLK